jgi:hypothetical protein
MIEPEIREAYVRIGELRASLDARVEALVRPELERRLAVDESIPVIPLYSRPRTPVARRGTRDEFLRVRHTVPKPFPTTRAGAQPLPKRNPAAAHHAHNAWPG